MDDIFILSNLIDNSTLINEPLKHTQRIKYTSFDVSKKYLVFGASSGSLYLFSRKPICKFLHLVPTNYGSINKLAISPGEKYISFATQKSKICVYSLNLSANSPPQILKSNLGDRILVSCLQWSATEKQFFYGDNTGQVNLVTLSTFMGRSLLNISIHPILFLDTPIVQICEFESLLLISNCSKCILCNTEFEEYKQIGSKPRDGEYGACFLMSCNEQLNPSRIYCARPGSRFWEVDLEGNVMQTHEFTEALTCPPLKLPIFKRIVAPIELENDENKYENCNGGSVANKTDIISFDKNDELIEYKPQNLKYAKLQVIHGEFILAYTEIAIYIFDMRQSKVILWTNEFNEILDCKIAEFDEIIIYTKSGDIYTVKLQILQSYAIDLVHQAKFIECSFLLKKNLKYFAEKAKEDYDLLLLNRIKDFLIDSNEYEMLNDLSVIFDSITQAEGELSSGSSLTTERKGGGKGDSLSSGATKINIEKKSESENGVYVLENSFCDNLRLNTDRDRQLKDALLTVTGKFGRNIIKYKFNIFNDEQKSLVNDLIPANTSSSTISTAIGQQRQMPFQNLQFDETDNEIVCKKPSATVRKATGTTSQAHTNQQTHQKSMTITSEEKTIYNLYLIFKSSKISNINFLDRYGCIFDLYTSREILAILSKLETVMCENGDSESEAKQNCYEMYFNYLKPELIYEFDKESLDFIIAGFCVVNKSSGDQDELITRCDLCEFPVRFDNTCRYHELGEILFKYLWSRNELDRCYAILRKVPAMFDVMCRFYIADNNYAKIIPISLSYGSAELFQEAAKQFNLPVWDKCFEMFLSIQRGQFNCINCDQIIELNVDRHFFYTWNCFVNLALENLKSNDILNLVLKYSDDIPCDAIEKDFYAKCLLKAANDKLQTY